MTNEEHIKKHILLHAELDELVADYIAHSRKGLTETSVLELMQWSGKQTHELDKEEKDEKETKVALSKEREDKERGRGNV